MFHVTAHVCGMRLRQARPRTSSRGEREEPPPTRPHPDQAMSGPRPSPPACRGAEKPAADLPVRPPTPGTGRTNSPPRAVTPSGEGPGFRGRCRGPASAGHRSGRGVRCGGNGCGRLPAVTCHGSVGRAAARPVPEPRRPPRPRSRCRARRRPRCSRAGLRPVGLLTRRRPAQGQDRGAFPSPGRATGVVPGSWASRSGVRSGGRLPTRRLALAEPAGRWGRDAPVHGLAVRENGPS